MDASLARDIQICCSSFQEIVNQFQIPCSSSSLTHEAEVPTIGSSIIEALSIIYSGNIYHF